MNELQEGLERARQQSLHYAQTLSEAQLRAKISDDAWTVGQVLEHIALVEQVTTFNIAKGLESGDPHEERSVDLESVILDRSHKLEAPPIISPTGQKSREEILRLLNSSHDALMSVLAPFTDADTLRTRPTLREHPMLGKLSAHQYAKAIGLHELRHIEQIKEILASTEASV